MAIVIWKNDFFVIPELLIGIRVISVDGSTDLLVKIIHSQFNVQSLPKGLDESHAWDDLGADALLRSTTFQL